MMTTDDEDDCEINFRKSRKLISKDRSVGAQPLSGISSWQEIAKYRQFCSIQHKVYSNATLCLSSKDTRPGSLFI